MAQNEDETRSKGGSKILRHTPRDEGWTPAEHATAEWNEAIELHLATHVGETSFVFHEIVSDKVHLDVHIIPPGPDRRFFMLYTTGMSAKPMTKPEGAPGSDYAELSILLPPTWECTEAGFKDERWYWPIRWLKTLARLPHDYSTWLGHGHTVPNGDPAQPFDPSTKLAGMLVASSITLDPEAHTIAVGDETVDLFTLWPLHANEMQFKLDRSMEALIDKFEQAQVSDIIDPGRPSAIARRKFLGLF